MTASLSSFKTPWRTLLAAVALQAAWVGAAGAVETYTVTITDMDAGTVAAGVTGDTLFRIDSATGAVSKISGTGARIGAGGGRSMVTIACKPGGGSGDCNANVNVRINVAGTPTKRARALTRQLFTMGTATLVSGPIGGPTSTFTIGPIGPNTSRTMFLGADLGVAGDDSGLATGDAESDFSVFVVKAPATPTSGAIGRAVVRVLRSITIAKTSDMAFGRVTLPPTGSGTVTMNPTTGAVTTTGGVTSLGAPTPTRAVFTVGGEGGQTFSVTLPATFALTGTATPLTVTTTTSAGPSNLLSASLGSAGTLAFGVGGSFTLASSTLTGDYTGNFTVTVAYN